MTGKRGLAGLFVLLAVAMLTGCWSDGDAPASGGTQAPAASTAVIGPSGGTLAGPDGVEVVVPAGALSQPTTIGIARSSAGAPAPLDAYPASSAIYELTPHDVSFNIPVTIRMPAGNNPDAQVFMAGPGQPWTATTAKIANGIAEWDRSSFSWAFVGVACFVPTSMSGDPYWCGQGSSHAGISATPPQAMTQTAAPADPQHGSYGAYRVDQAATLQFTSLVIVPGNCGNVTVRFLRRRFASTQQWYEVPAQLVATQSPVMIAGPNHSTGTATFSVPFSYLDSGGNQFVTAASYDCPSIVHTRNGSGGDVYSWDYANPYHTNLFGDGIMVQGNVPQPTVFFTVGGAVSGLTGAGLVLQNNGTDFTPVAADGNFVFAASIGDGAPYNVTVLTQPAGQTCTVQNGSGIAGANVTNVVVTCIVTFPIGGNVNGLVGTGLVLQNNGADNLSFTVSGAFTFLTQVAAGGAYNVTVLTQPSGSNCTVQNGAGTASAPVTNVVVTCISSGALALVANSTSNTLSIFRTDASSGVLTSIGTVGTGQFPFAVAVHPNGKYAYVTNLTGGSISSFSIDNITGVLTPIASPNTQNPISIAMDPLGRFVWVANYGFNTVSAFAIGVNGALTAVGAPLATNSTPRAIAAHPSGNFVYVGSEAGNSILVYGVNPGTGALTLVPGTLVNSILGPSSISIHPSGNFAFAASPGGSSVAAFIINPVTGALTSPSYTNTAGSAFSVAVHPNGQYVYVTSGSTSVTAFSINPVTGALTAGSPVATGANPHTVAINTTGTYLYVTNLTSKSVSSFSISAGGATLTSLGATVPTGNAPEGIAVTP